MQCPLKTVTQLLTGKWLQTDFKVNGHNVLKKIDQSLFLWYTAHGPAWYIADSYVPDGGTWENLRCFARIDDRNGSPCGDIFIPFQNQQKATWVLTAGVVFLPKMSQTLLQRWDLFKKRVEHLEKENVELKMEVEQLKLQLQQYELEQGQVGMD